MGIGSYPDGVTDADIEREMAAPEQRRCGTCAKWVESPLYDGVGVCERWWPGPARVELLGAQAAALRTVRDDCGEECPDWEELS